MSDPHGYQLVAVPDVVREPKTRPRHTYVIVADGLGAEPARATRGMARLRQAGTCRATEVGLPSVSRPVYAVMSTGVEQDRTGIRNNDEDRPIAAESIWGVAHDAGLTVSARSELPWFRELFPLAFEPYQELARSAVYLSPLPASDLALIHPVYIDESGHDFGAASPEYAAQVARFDGELMGFLDAVDLTQDLVVVTADHGHTARGGHGGPQVTRVETCLAGPGVRRGTSDAVISSRHLAPLLAVLLGVPFPRHMRPDGVELVWDMVDLPRAYLADRREALGRFRAGNPDWEAIYADGYTIQHRTMALAAFGLLLLFAIVTKVRRVPTRDLVPLAAWMAGTIAVMVAGHVLCFGSFDTSAINRRAYWVPRVCAMCAVVAAAALALRWRWTRDLGGALADLALLVACGLYVNLALVWVFGSPLGFPAPGPLFYFLPFFASAATLCAAAVLAAASPALLFIKAKTLTKPPPRSSRRRSSRRP